MLNNSSLKKLYLLVIILLASFSALAGLPSKLPDFDGLRWGSSIREVQKKYHLTASPTQADVCLYPENLVHYHKRDLACMYYTATVVFAGAPRLAVFNFSKAGKLVRVNIPNLMVEAVETNTRLFLFVHYINLQNSLDSYYGNSIDRDTHTEGDGDSLSNVIWETPNTTILMSLVYSNKGTIGTLGVDYLYTPWARAFLASK